MTFENAEGRISVESSNVELGDALRTHATDEILKTAGKYFGHLVSASAHFNHEGSFYRSTVVLQMGGLKRVSAEAQHKDIYSAFNSALEKVGTQLRRAKREMREDKAHRTDKDALLREGLRPLRD